MRVTIPVNQKASKIHFLQSCRQGGGEVGAKVASYWIHYDDGTSQECPVIFGSDLTGFWIHHRPEDELAGVGPSPGREILGSQMEPGRLGWPARSAES